MKKLQTILNSKKYIEYEIIKCNQNIMNLENNINILNNRFSTSEQVPLSQINEIIKLTSELNNIKKQLSIKMKSIEYIDKLQEYSMKPRVEPIKTEIIKVKEQIKENDPVREIQMIVEDKTEDKTEDKNINEVDLYSVLNNFQDQINNIMTRLSNLELKNSI
jgi:hypothetical protein